MKVICDTQCYPKVGQKLGVCNIFPFTEIQGLQRSGMACTGQGLHACVRDCMHRSYDIISDWTKHFVAHSYNSLSHTILFNNCLWVFSLFILLIFRQRFEHRYLCKVLFNIFCSLFHLLKTFDFNCANSSIKQEQQ